MIEMDICGDERTTTITVEQGETIAAAAGRQGVSLYGSCNGVGECLQCRRDILKGVENLIHKRTGKPPPVLEGRSPCVQTCQYIPIASGVAIRETRKSLAGSGIDFLQDLLHTASDA